MSYLSEISGISNDLLIRNPTLYLEKPESGFAKIFIVEDELIFAEDLREILEEHGYRVCGSVPSGEEALLEIPRETPDLVLIDIVLAGKMSGIELADILHTTADIPFIYLTSNIEDDTIATAKRTSPYGYIPKPFDQRALFSTIEIALFKHRADKQIRESEERYRTFVENIQGIAYRIDREGILEFLHGSIEKISGYQAADFLKGELSWADIVHKEDRGIASPPNEPEGLHSPKSRSREYRIVRKDGEIRWIHDLKQEVYRGSHTELFYEGMIYDITPLKILEADLKKACDIRTIILLMSGQFFRKYLQKISAGSGQNSQHALLSSLSDILGGVGYEMGIPVISLCQSTPNENGKSGISEMLRCVHPMKVSPASRNRINNIPSLGNGLARWNDQLLKGHPVYGIRTDFPSSDQLYFEDTSISSVIVVPIFCEDQFWGFIQGTYFTEQHIWTEYEISSMQIAADVIATILETGSSSENLATLSDVLPGLGDRTDELPATLMDSAVDIVFIADREGKILHMNRAGLDFFEVDHGSERMKKTYETFQVFIRENVTKFPPASLSQELDGPMELELLIGEQPAFLDLTLSTISRSTQGHSLFMGITRDITRQKLLQKKQHEIQKKLQLMQKIFRHDLNNQITAILGYLSLLKKDIRSPAALGFIEKEERVVESIRKSMRIAKVYENLGDGAAVWINVPEVFSGIWANLGQEHIQLDLPQESIEVYVDPLFRNVVFNLLDNTLRHGGENLSSIRISVNSNKDEMIILYEDNGKGILIENKEKIFNREYYTNNGFGLLLSREILYLTGLSIRETGIPGTGACFEITVPKGMWRTTSAEDK